jgi:asparagine synthase (glutamine-hydrolysing)
MAHRGPDNFGEYYSGNLALFHYRLSILDLEERSNQPFFNDNNDKVIVYNGEIYNYKNLAAEYNLKLHTTSDTEVILNTIDAKGNDAVKEWNGIFAFAMHDTVKNSLTLARDRFGVKPLYFFENDFCIAFSSEAKVIMNWLDSFRLNFQGLSEYMWYGNTLSLQTMVDGMIKLKPGITREIDLKNFNQTDKVYWSIARDIKQDNKSSFDQSAVNVRDLLEKAVQKQLASDVPIGILLSGGIDSSAVTAFASRHVNGKLNTYSVEYDFNIGDKSELAKADLIAKKFNTNHHEFKINSADSIDIFEMLVLQYDEPFADAANIPLYMLAKECKSDVTVVLQGDGGDELFAGYRRYSLLNSLAFWKLATKLSSTFSRNGFIKQRLKRMSVALNQKSDAMRMAFFMTQNTLEKNPESIFQPQYFKLLSLQNPFQEYVTKNQIFSDKDLVQRMLYTDFEILLPHTFLEKVDKATMKCSIEARVPFLDNDLTEYVLSLPSSYKIKKGDKKFLLKESLKGIVPDSILNAPKRGFDVPYKKWLKTTMFEYSKSKISEYKNPNNLLNKDVLLNMLEEHKNDIADNGVILWKALILLVWLEKYERKLKFD